MCKTHPPITLVHPFGEVCLKGDCSLGKGQKWTLLEAPGSFIGIPILPMKIDQLLSKLINLRARNPERKITYLTYFEMCCRAQNTKKMSNHPTVEVSKEQ